jgi:hypothetical protein
MLGPLFVGCWKQVGVYDRNGNLLGKGWILEEGGKIIKVTTLLVVNGRYRFVEDNVLLYFYIVFMRGQLYYFETESF